MADFSKLPTISSDASQRSTPTSPVYAVERAKVLFSCYRRADANDPDGYTAAIGAVLTLYDHDLVREVTDPRTGIQTTQRFETFLPNVGELKRYCDQIAGHRERIQKLSELPPPLAASRRIAYPGEPQPGSLANVFIPETDGYYARFCEWAQSAAPRLFKFGVASDRRPGIWISRDIWDERGGLSASSSHQ